MKYCLFLHFYNKSYTGMFIVNPRSFSIQQCSFLGGNRGLLEEKKINPPSHSTTRILQWEDTKSTMNTNVSSSNGKKENSMLCILKDLINCNAVLLHQHNWFMIFLIQHSKNSHRGPRDSLHGKGMDYNFWHRLRFLVHHSWLYCSQRASICSNFQDLFTAAHRALEVIPKNDNPSLPRFHGLFLQLAQSFSPYQSIRTFFSLCSLHWFFTIHHVCHWSTSI